MKSNQKWKSVLTTRIRNIEHGFIVIVFCYFFRQWLWLPRRGWWMYVKSAPPAFIFNRSWGFHWVVNHTPILLKHGFALDKLVVCSIEHIRNFIFSEQDCMTTMFGITCKIIGIISSGWRVKLLRHYKFWWML